MRTRLITGVALVAGVLAASAAEAQRPRGPYDVRPNERYCRDMIVDRNSTTMVCQHYTMQQCLDSRASPGERCYLNPALRGNR